MGPGTRPAGWPLGVHHTGWQASFCGWTLRALIHPCTDMSFDERVRNVVSLIPRSRLATYGQVADWIGAWGCARQVGWALRRLSVPSEVPWQRVVNAKGRISMSLSRAGSDLMQRQLLIEEGIPVDEEGRLPLKRFLWTPDPEDLILELNESAVARE